MNWTQFNRISFSFLFISYPSMMCSCLYYLLKVGFWSYAGFAAVEVIILSTFLAVLMFLDALSSIKCRTLGKAKTTAKSVKVASGADYESDEDDHPNKRAMKNQKQTMRRAMVAAAADSVDYEESEVSFSRKRQVELATLSEKDVSQANALMDEETKK